MTQLSKMTDFEIVSMEVSKPVSISTSDLGTGSAFAGVYTPREITMMSERNIRMPKMVKASTDKK
jgi:hypothetical protein